MALAQERTAVAVIDTDTHITEPFDLWTSRLPKKWQDDCPTVAVHPGTGHHHWKVGDTWLAAVGYFAYAGWHSYPPDMPWELEDVDPGAYDPHKRLERMDEYGIWAQVLYPNIIGFEAPLFMRLDPDLSIACVAAYNDFLQDFRAVDPERFIPVAMVPFWDMDAAVAEIERCAQAGFTGILFANKYEQIGMPHFCDPYWDPIYSAAQAAGMCVNFHVGFSSSQEGAHTEEKKAASRRNFDARAAARMTSVGIMTNADSIASIVTSGICDRFPGLPFVSVESGFGYIPYLMESLDWHWKGYGAHLQSPMLPSEYFRRQCYGSFWFETGTLPLLETYPDNFMFETDYPHPTSMSPGPVSPAEVPSVHIDKHFRDLDPEVARKALHDNAARVYRLTRKDENG
jgi:predicted TIM-barrel fold metal-dependent hydrolase